jgi:hypothetical protein
MNLLESIPCRDRIVSCPECVTRRISIPGVIPSIRLEYVQLMTIGRLGPTGDLSRPTLVGYNMSRGAAGQYSPGGTWWNVATPAWAAMPTASPGEDAWAIAAPTGRTPEVDRAQARTGRTVLTTMNTASCCGDPGKCRPSSRAARVCARRRDALRRPRPSRATASGRMAHRAAWLTGVRRTAGPCPAATTGCRTGAGCLRAPIARIARRRRAPQAEGAAPGISVVRPSPPDRNRSATGGGRPGHRLRAARRRGPMARTRTPTRALPERPARGASRALPGLRVLRASRALPGLRVLRASRALPGLRVLRASRALPGLQVLRASRALPGLQVRRASRALPGLRVLRASRALPGLRVPLSFRVPPGSRGARLPRVPGAARAGVGWGPKRHEESRPEPPAR